MMRGFCILFLGMAVYAGMTCMSSTALAQNNDQEAVIQRMNQLEAETQALRAEIDRLQTRRLPQVDQSGVPVIPVTDTSVAPLPSSTDIGDVSYTTPVADPQSSGEYYSMDELKAEMKKLVWKKGEFSITPYGYLWGNTVYETERSYTGDYTLWVNSATTAGEGTFHADGKNTRLGIDVGGPRLSCFGNAMTGGKIEIDFQNSFATENRGAILLRHAYVEVKNDQFRLLAGQTWDVASPLMPNTVTCAVSWDAGNTGFRRPQLRAERFFDISDMLLFTVQGSANAVVVTDAYTGVTSDHSGWPLMEGRMAMTVGQRGKGCYPIEVGVSSLIGEERFNFSNARDLPARTWMFCLDLKAPVTQYFGFQGEWFTGENISSFFGGIGQGYNFTRRSTVHSHGGWMETYYYWTPQWHSHVGYGLDDPNDDELTAVDARTFNQAYFGNVMYDITKQFVIGFEVTQWRTVYKDQLPGESVRFEFMARYAF
jgi:hypothetical protein